MLSSFAANLWSLGNIWGIIGLLAQFEPYPCHLQHITWFIPLIIVFIDILLLGSFSYSPCTIDNLEVFLVKNYLTSVRYCQYLLEVSMNDVFFLGYSSAHLL